MVPICLPFRGILSKKRFFGILRERRRARMRPSRSRRSAPARAKPRRDTRYTPVRRAGLARGFCAAALNEALLRHGKPRFANPGQGARFTGAAFAGKLAAAGGTISMHGRGRFMDNILIGRFWRSIKFERVPLKAHARGGERRGAGRPRRPPTSASSPEQSIAGGRVAHRNASHRGGGRSGGCAASLGYPRRAVQNPPLAIPSSFARRNLWPAPPAAAIEAAGSYLTFDHTSRRDRTLVQAARGPANGGNFNNTFVNAYVAERGGFEPPIGLRLCRISSAVLSTAQPPLHGL